MVTVIREGDTIEVLEHKKCRLKCNIGDTHREDMSCGHYDDALARIGRNGIKHAQCPKFRDGRLNKKAYYSL